MNVFDNVGYELRRNKSTLIRRAVQIMKNKDVADDMKLSEGLYAGAHELAKTLARL